MSKQPSVTLAGPRRDLGYIGGYIGYILVGLSPPNSTLPCPKMILAPSKISRMFFINLTCLCWWSYAWIGCHSVVFARCLNMPYIMFATSSTRAGTAALVELSVRITLLFKWISNNRIFQCKWVNQYFKTYKMNHKKSQFAHWLLPSQVFWWNAIQAKMQAIEKQPILLPPIGTQNFNF